MSFAASRSNLATLVFAAIVTGLFTEAPAATVLASVVAFARPNGVIARVPV